MSDRAAAAPRPVSLVTIFVILAVLVAFLELVNVGYLNHRSAAPQNQVPENLTADQKWRENPEARRAYLAELRAKQAKQGTSYAWIDQRKGVVQLPIERAMELIVQENSGGK